MKPWSRENTREWISQLENRLEDIDYYLARTVEWCENNGVWDDEKVISLSVLTCLWVINMRSESISKRELYEILGIQGWEDVDDCAYQIGDQLSSLDYEEMLELVAGKLPE